MVVVYGCNALPIEEQVSVFYSYQYPEKKTPIIKTSVLYILKL